MARRLDPDDMCPLRSRGLKITPEVKDLFSMLFLLLIATFQRLKVSHAVFPLNLQIIFHTEFLSNFVDNVRFCTFF